MGVSYQTPPVPMLTWEISIAYQIASGMVSELQCVIAPAVALFVDQIFVHVYVSIYMFVLWLCVNYYAFINLLGVLIQSQYCAS